MIIEKGNMWDVFGKTDLFLITTNPIIRKDGAVVMGRGIAKQAKDRFPRLPYDFACTLRNMPDMNIDEFGKYDGQVVGYFMVKRHWREAADLDIIAESCRQLASCAHMWTRVDLNFPGIGNGKLKREDVLPLLQQLPDHVHVWEY